MVHNTHSPQSLPVTWPPPSPKDTPNQDEQWTPSSTELPSNTHKSQTNWAQCMAVKPGESSCTSFLDFPAQEQSLSFSGPSLFCFALLFPFVWWLCCPFPDLLSGINELRMAASCVSLSASPEEEEETEERSSLSSSTSIFHFSWIPGPLSLPRGLLSLHGQFLNLASLSLACFLSHLDPSCFRKFVRAVAGVNCAPWQVCKSILWYSGSGSPY